MERIMCTYIDYDVQIKQVPMINKQGYDMDAY